MRNLKNKNWTDILRWLVYLRTRNKEDFSWIEETYWTLCDLGYATPIGEYIPNDAWLGDKDRKELERWKKNAVCLHDFP